MSELVIQRHTLTDTQLNEAVVITRSTPGPVGLYLLVSATLLPMCRAP
jgi:chromate transporter